MTSAKFFLTFSLISALVFGLPMSPDDTSLDELDVSKECSNASDEFTKNACDGKLLSKVELSSSVKSSLQKIGGGSKMGETSLQRRKNNDKSTKEQIDTLENIQHEVQAAYIGAVKSAKKLKSHLKPEQAGLLSVYLKQLKIATDYSVEKIDECIKKLKDEESGGKKGYSNSGVQETVEPALVNVFRQYDNLYDYMSDLK